MFRCKDKDGIIRQVTFRFINGAWVAAIVSCREGIYLKDEDEAAYIPNVKQLELTAEGNEVSINWRPSSLYQTEIQVRTDGGDWTTLPLVEIGAGTYES
jgi:hypothetical protein